MAADEGYEHDGNQYHSDSDSDRHNYDDFFADVDPSALPAPVPMDRIRRPPPLAGGFSPEKGAVPVYEPEPGAPPPGPWAHIKAPDPPPKPIYKYTLKDGVWIQELLPEDQWVPADPRLVRFKHVPPNQHSESVRRFIANSEMPDHWLERDPSRSNYRPQVVVGGSGIGFPAMSLPPAVPDGYGHGGDPGSAGGDAMEC
eukprot:Amastigsp_a174526_299.p1 type:complete len:199 gc:universal Amastigsp_a174526_299:681-85(-)